MRVVYFGSVILVVGVYCGWSCIGGCDVVEPGGWFSRCRRE